MKLKQSIKSRYSIKNISKDSYNTISVTQSNAPILGKKTNSSMEAGYIFAPYLIDINGTILLDGVDTMMDDMRLKVMKLKRDIKINDILDGE